MVKFSICKVYIENPSIIAGFKFFGRDVNYKSLNLEKPNASTNHIKNNNKFIWRYIDNHENYLDCFLFPSHIKFIDILTGKKYGSESIVYSDLNDKEAIPLYYIDDNLITNYYRDNYAFNKMKMMLTIGGFGSYIWQNRGECNKIFYTGYKTRHEIRMCYF